MGNREFVHCIPLLREGKGNCSVRLGIRNTSCLSYQRHQSFLDSALSHNNTGRSLLPPAKRAWRESN